MSAQRKWTKRRIVEAMRRWRKFHGRPPRLHEWNPPPSDEWPAASTVQQVYGRWSDALRAARLPRQPTYSRIRSPRRRWKREDVITAVQRWAAEHDGYPPAYADWDPAMAKRRGQEGRVEAFYAGDWPHASVACRAIGGSWTDVLAAAGFDVD